MQLLINLNSYLVFNLGYDHGVAIQEPGVITGQPGESSIRFYDSVTVMLNG